MDGDTGRPLADAFVGSDFGATAKTDALGNHRFDDVPLGDLDSDRQWTVFAQPAGYKSQARNVVAKADQEVRPDYAGEDRFTCRTADAHRSSEPATATIRVAPVNDAPTASDAIVTVDEDAAPVTVDLGAHDADAETGDADLAYEIVTPPANGKLTGSGPTVAYDSDGDANGVDSFTYRVRDRGDPDGCDAGAGCSPALESAVANVRLDIEPRNDAPVC